MMILTPTLNKVPHLQQDQQPPAAGQGVLLSTQTQLLEDEPQTTNTQQLNEESFNTSHPNKASIHQVQVQSTFGGSVLLNRPRHQIFQTSTAHSALNRPGTMVTSPTSRLEDEIEAKPTVQNKQQSVPNRNQVQKQSCRLKYVTPATTMVSRNQSKTTQKSQQLRVLNLSLRPEKVNSRNKRNKLVVTGHTNHQTIQQMGQGVTQSKTQKSVLKPGSQKPKLQQAQLKTILHEHAPVSLKLVPTTPPHIHAAPQVPQFEEPQLRIKTIVPLQQANLLSPNRFQGKVASSSLEHVTVEDHKRRGSKRPQSAVHSFSTKQTEMESAPFTHIKIKVVSPKNGPPQSRKVSPRATRQPGGLFQHKGKNVSRQQLIQQLKIERPRQTQKSRPQSSKTPISAPSQCLKEAAEQLNLHEQFQFKPTAMKNRLPQTKLYQISSSPTCHNHKRTASAQSSKAQTIVVKQKRVHAAPGQRQEQCDTTQLIESEEEDWHQQEPHVFSAAELQQIQQQEYVEAEELEHGLGITQAVTCLLKSEETSPADSPTARHQRANTADQTLKPVSAPSIRVLTSKQQPSRSLRAHHHSATKQSSNLFLTASGACNSDIKDLVDQTCDNGGPADLQPESKLVVYKSRPNKKNATTKSKVLSGPQTRAAGALSRPLFVKQPKPSQQGPIRSSWHSPRQHQSSARVKNGLGNSHTLTEIEELKYIAAVTFIKNEKRAMSSFAKNNKRTEVNSKDIIKGLNPYQLLCSRDKELLTEATQLFDKHYEQMQAKELERQRQMNRNKHRIRSVTEAEVEACQDGLINYVSFQNHNQLDAAEHICQTHTSQIIQQAVHDSHRSTSTMRLASQEQCQQLVGKRPSLTVVDRALQPPPQYTSELETFSQMQNCPLNTQQIGQGHSPLQAPKAPPSSTAQMYSQAHRICQEQKQNKYVKQWATDQLQQLLQEFEAKLPASPSSYQGALGATVQIPTQMNQQLIMAGCRPLIEKRYSAFEQPSLQLLESSKRRSIAINNTTQYENSVAPTGTLMNINKVDTSMQVNSRSLASISLFKPNSPQNHTSKAQE